MLRLIPQKTHMNERFVSSPTGAAGKTKIAYTGRSAGYPSYQAKVSVADAAGASVAAHIVCSVGGAPSVVVRPARGRLRRLSILVRRIQPPPNTYEIECTVRNAAGRALVNHILTFEFERDNHYDVPIPATLNLRGQASAIPLRR